MKKSFEIIKVTPELAADWLSTNASNRGLSMHLVAKFARDMRGGFWWVTPQPIVFNGKGQLLDGQHRLQAVIESQTATEMMVSRGWDHDVRKYIDRGRNRTLADRFRMEGVENNVNLKAAIAGCLYRLDTGGGAGSITGDEAALAIAIYAKGFAWMDKTSFTTGHRRAAYIASVIWALPLGKRVVEFNESVQSGAGLKLQSAEFAMRKVLDTVKLTGGSGQTELALKTCNCIAAAYTGRKVEKVYASTIGYMTLAKLLKKKLPAEGRLVSP